MPLLNYREQRCEAHTKAQQKLRNAIKYNYNKLKKLMPSCQQTTQVGTYMSIHLDSYASEHSEYELNKAIILQHANAHIQNLQHLKHLKEGERSTLRKEKRTLQIMQANYDKIIKAH
ncbi:max-like protein X [Euwallacea fornicatus]|uniref:max-like protein X n=1 Tax=Euwallacea fornicatus TaxID=995702 RepID=UPI00338D9B06